MSAVNGVHPKSDGQQSLPINLQRSKLKRSSAFIGGGSALATGFSMQEEEQLALNTKSG